MHQPQYKNLVTGQYYLPWTYLHAIKDYVDMAAHLEQVPQARAVVNFAPILLEQIDDYGRQIEGYLSQGSAINDPLLSALASPVLPHDREQCTSLIKACLKVNRSRLVDRFPQFKLLVDMADYFLETADAMNYVQDQYLVDLLMWYHLAWLGETVRREDPIVKNLIKKARYFTYHDRRTLLQVMGQIISGIIGRYRSLAENGTVELSVTPYAHPIVPIMLDMQSTREAMPDAPLPALEQYPGGAERARWHFHRGIEVFEKYFGKRPVGCWPSEGSVSDATVELIGEFGFQWLATGENVFRNSVHHYHHSDESADDDDFPGVHHGFRLQTQGPACFFRDDGLSDLVGFTYSDWHADDAVGNLLHHLENISANAKSTSDTVVSIVLDGENAWEYYPENGYYFLSALYEKLAEHPDIELTTFSQVLDSNTEIKNLGGLVAGSWVYGTFSTWIGEKDKNRGWDILGDVKREYDRALAEGRLSGENIAKCEIQMAICEGSDWFWWFGDYNPEDSVSDFEQLFRTHVANMYQLMGCEPPEYLSHAFTQGKGAPAAGGVMRTGSA